MDLATSENKTFWGSNFTKDYWNYISDNSMEAILDLWQAGYADDHIMAALNIKSMPPKDFIYQKLNRCLNCLHNGHVSSACPGMTCDHCFLLGYFCDLHARDMDVNVVCTKCLATGHIKNACTMGLRCKICAQLGHMG